MRYITSFKREKNIQGIDTEPVQLSYAMSAQDKMNTVDAYENLLFDCLKGDATNFTLGRIKIYMEVC